MIRTYSELMAYNTFIDRYNYLKLNGQIGVETFGLDRYINQALYKSQRWLETRRKVIIRDKGCDLAIPEFEIADRVIIHHMNPITLEDIEEERDYVFDPEFLISTSFRTHNAIHYGDESLLLKLPIERSANDMCPWKNGG